jgi:hypothetical protein
MSDARLIRSMSRKGCSPDNAASEGFFGRLKTEMFCPRDWRATTVDEFIDALDSYIRWYNARGSRSRLALLVRSNTRKVLESRHNQSTNLAAPPLGQFLAEINTLASFQSCSRRQHVATEPKRNRVGKRFRRIPVFVTNRMPLSAARSDTHGRP